MLSEEVMSIVARAKGRLRLFFGGQLLPSRRRCCRRLRKHNREIEKGAGLRSEEMPVCRTWAEAATRNEGSILLQRAGSGLA